MEYSRRGCELICFETKAFAYRPRDGADPPMRCALSGINVSTTFRRAPAYDQVARKRPATGCSIPVGRLSTR